MTAVYEPEPSPLRGPAAEPRASVWDPEPVAPQPLPEPAPAVVPEDVVVEPAVVEDVAPEPAAVEELAPEPVVVEHVAPELAVVEEADVDVEVLEVRSPLTVVTWAAGTVLAGMVVLAVMWLLGPVVGTAALVVAMVVVVRRSLRAPDDAGGA